MKAITITPKAKHSIKLKELEKPTPKDNEMLVKVLEAGICRTDLEIYEGLYGETPEKEDFLIMGHESIGIVESSCQHTNLKKGDYVTRTVRRPCQSHDCYPCRHGEQDFCTTGKFTETGIKGLHGIMTEYYAERPEFLVKVPKQYKAIGVLMEPLSFAEKAVNQLWYLLDRFSGMPRKALILGAGPIGLLEAMILKEHGTGSIETYVTASSRRGNLKSAIAEEIGAKYVSTQDTNLESLGKFDIIMESSGSVDMIKESFSLLGANGVICLTSITGEPTQTMLPLGKINLDFVLGNKAIVGAVNAQACDYKRGIEHLEQFESMWPGVMQKLITRRVKLDNFAEAFEKRPGDIKTVIEFY